MKRRTITLSDGTRVELRCFLPGRYRMTMSVNLFAQIVREGGNWRATIRDSGSGALVRHAGIWTSLREAAAEAVDIQRGLTAPILMRNAAGSAHVDADCQKRAVLAVRAAEARAKETK